MPQIIFIPQLNKDRICMQIGTDMCRIQQIPNSGFRNEVLEVSLICYLIFTFQVKLLSCFMTFKQDKTSLKNLNIGIKTLNSYWISEKVTFRTSETH